MGSKLEWIVLAALAAVVAYGGFRYLQQDRPTPLAAAPSAELEPVQIVDAPVLKARNVAGGLPESGQWRGNPRIADLNADGHLDLIASIRRWDRRTPGEGIFAWLGDGAGNWTLSVDGMRRDMGYGGADVGDIDGDGRVDIAFSGHDFTPHLFIAGEDGSWTPITTGIEVEGISSDVALGDYNGDGALDLATLGFYPQEAGLRVFPGDGTGGLGEFDQVLGILHYGAQVSFKDIDGDGIDELLTSTDMGPQVWHYDADAGWQSRSEGLSRPDIGGSDLALEAYDLDGDGYLELIAAGMAYEGHAPLRIFRWNGESWASWGNGIPDDETYFDVIVAQLVKNAPPHIVCAGRHGITVFSMERPGEFERLGRIEETEGVINVCSGDLIENGTDEIVYVGFGGVRVLALEDIEGGVE